MRHHVNGWEQTYEIAGQKFCHCGHWLPALRYRWKGETTLMPAYAVTIHKSPGSEYPAVVIPVLTQHYTMLQRNLLYTGVTRGKRLVVLVGAEKGRRHSRPQCLRPEALVKAEGTAKR